MFTLCDERNHFLCEEMPAATTTTSTTTTITITTTTTSTFKSTNNTIFKTTANPQSADSTERSEVGFLVYIIPLVLATLGGSAVLVVILWRRKMKKNNEIEKELKSVSVDNMYPEINQSPTSSYFVLEKKNFHKSTPESILTSENPYDDIEEGDYDHLRGKRSRKTEEEEHTYQHSSAGISAVVSDYDIMARSVKTVQEEDGGYDHVHPDIKRNSDYGNKEEYAKTLTDDPYDISMKS